NTVNFRKSMHYNPMAYIHSEKDILTFVNTLIVNTKGEGQPQNGDDFWVKAEKLLYQAYIGYMFYECVEEERNFSTLIDMINASETREDDETFKNAIDLMFEDLEKREPEHFAVMQYKKYKLAAGKTAKSILISCGARLAPFDIRELRELMAYDEMEIDLMGDRKTATFMIMSDTDGTFNFVLALMQYQMFNLLCEKADDKYGGSLPFHVRFILDEFANIGQIPQFDRLCSTIRSRNISVAIILQSKSQLHAIYDKKASTIIDDCDSRLFLGGSDKEGLKDISEMLGKETIDTDNTSENRGANPSSGTNHQKLGRDLMTPDELAVMDRGKCILQLTGSRAFFSDKYDITKHKRYKQLSDYNKKNTFDVEKFVSRKLVLKKSQTIEVFDAGQIEEDN
nr:type IV secretory system conjugative DNA transfer family protein [Acetatifactor sp.]